MIYVVVRFVSIGIVVALLGALVAVDQVLDLPHWLLIVVLLGICAVTAALQGLVVRPAGGPGDGDR